jgi:hypothetical protein
MTLTSQLFVFHRADIKEVSYQHMDVICTSVSLRRSNEFDSIQFLASFSTKKRFFGVYAMKSNPLCHEMGGLYVRFGVFTAVTMKIPSSGM